MEGFSVKSLYIFLDSVLLHHEQRSPIEYFGFKHIWKSGVRSMVSAIAWQLFLDRIPTRDNLRLRGVIRPEEERCPVCTAEVETSQHLFLHCRFAAGIWYKLTRWLGVVTILPPILCVVSE
ncbi:unnamed protein product [Trifolium pratense]|uniref:Uncharacterized protein n=1 Tax=Trifolium pratense TaxID=57577 RepID=A0ACB0L2D8_TRIPR|nr:unnamed protein product [Trifolium pratense]